MRNLIYIFFLFSLTAFGQSKDDFKHFAAGMAISATSNQLSESLFDGKHKSATLITAMVVATGWEIWRQNGFDWKDVGYTMGGAFTAYALHEWLGIGNGYLIAVGVGTLGILVSF